MITKRQIADEWHRVKGPIVGLTGFGILWASVYHYGGAWACAAATGALCVAWAILVAP